MSTPSIKAIKRAIEILESDAEELKLAFSDNGKSWDDEGSKEDYEERKQIAASLRKAIPEGL